MRLQYTNLWEFYYFCQPLFVTFFIAFFLLHFVLINLINFLNKTTKFMFLNSSMLTYFFLCTVFFTILFFLKLLLNFFFFNLFTPNNIILPQTPLFADTLVCLALLVTLVSWVYLSERFLHKTTSSVIYFYIFFICTLNMVYATNVLIMFVYFEFLFLPSLFFVYRYGYAKKVDKTINFLLKWTLSGSFLVLLTLCILFNSVYTLELGDLYLLQFSFYENFFFLTAFFLGFGIKIPVWPFYYWLTKVHVEAPTGFSIFLSGFLVKTAFFCFTIFFYLFNNEFFTIIFGTIVIWGILDSSFRMWSSIDIKRLIAFATIQEMNFILLFLLFFNSNLYTLVNLFLLVHGVLSAFLFYLVDQIQKQALTRNITALSGLAVYTPRLTLLVWFALLIFRGFPVFVKFFIEWELLSVLSTHFLCFGFFVFLIASFSSVLGFSKVFFIVLYGQPKKYINTADVLKKDLTIGYLLVSVLFFLNFTILLFICLVFF